MLDAYVHQDVPFERLVESSARSGLGRQPLFQTMLVLNPGWTATSRRTASERGRYPAAAREVRPVPTFTEEDGAWSGRPEYSAELFDRPTAEGLAARYGLLLEQGLADLGGGDRAWRCCCRARRGG